MSFKITEMFAFVVTDEDGSEGIPSFTIPFEGTMPLLGSDMARIDSLLPLAQQMSDLYKKEIRLVKFTNMELVKTLKPE